MAWFVYCLHLFVFILCFIFPGKHNWNFEIQDIIHGVYHEYYDESPKCGRALKSGKNLIEEASLWTLSIPHPEESGKCFTYKYKILKIKGNFI